MGEDFNLDNLKEGCWQAVDSNGKVVCEGKGLDLTKEAQEFELPQATNNDNELLKPETHKNEMFFNVNLQAVKKLSTKQLLKLFKNNIFYKLKKIRKKYHSPKRRVQEYYKFFKRENVVSINDIDTSNVYFKIT